MSRRFCYPNRLLLCGQARLFGDRIELAGWKLHGRHRRRIPLSRVVHLDYHHLEDGSNLSLFLDSGEVVEIQVEEAHLWRQHFENWLSYHVLASAKVMSEQDKATAIAG